MATPPPPRDTSLAAFARTRLGFAAGAVFVASFGLWFGIIAREDREMRRVRDELVRKEAARRVEMEMDAAAAAAAAATARQQGQ